MDLCDQFVKSLAKGIDVTSFTHTPDMDLFPCDLTQYLSAGDMEILIKMTGKNNATESLLMKHLKELDNPTRPSYNAAF